jgi:cell division transport system permease protein
MPIILTILKIFTFFLIYKNIENNLYNNTQEKIIIFLKKNTSDISANKLRKIISSRDDIISVKYYTEIESLKLYAEENGRNTIIENFDYNPLPKTMVILKKFNNISGEKLYYFLDKNSNIELYKSNKVFLKKIKYTKDTVFRLSTFCIFSLIALLFLIINSFIKSEAFKMKPEIQIYNLLGARSSFIRRRYIYTSVIYLSISFLLSYVVLQYLFYLFTNYIHIILDLYSTDHVFLNISFVEALFSYISIIIIMLLMAFYEINKLIKSRIL